MSRNVCGELATCPKRRSVPPVKLSRSIPIADELALMQPDQALREHLICLLDWQDAHANFEVTLRDWPPELRGIKPNGCPHTAWQLLEHLRICQWDILRFSRDPEHASPEFPSGYWPTNEAPPSDKSWDESIVQFRKDLAELKRLLADPSVDLFVPIAHGQGQTVLREMILVADHNSYHLGQLLLLRRLLGCWPA